MAKKVSELQGAELDRWVANAHGMMLYTPDWQPSRNWAQGGPILEREYIQVTALYGFGDKDWRPVGEVWEAVKTAKGRRATARGHSYLEAAMRCYVESRLGPEVDDEG